MSAPTSPHPQTNWAGNYSYRARAIHAPRTLEQLQEILSSSPHVRVLGSRHSFTDIADSAELVTLDHVDRELVVDRDQMAVSVPAAVHYDELIDRLTQEGLALSNLASLPHISVAGAISTATHGSGDHNGNLATDVVSLKIVTSDGGVLDVARGDPEFAGLVVGLGAVGALVQITLAVEPAYEVRQRVFERLSWRALFENFEAIFASGYSVSAFTRWGESVDQVWVKTRVGNEPEDVVTELFGAAAATEHKHPIIGLDPIHATRQLGVPGPWSERLPHFRSGFTPSSGAELQSEYLVPRHHAVNAIDAVLRLGPTLGPLTQVSEIRTVAADGLWMSPEYARDAVGIHFTWKPRQKEVERALVDVERALVPFEARPHWGKLFLMGADSIRRLYERLDDFAALLERVDARGAFRNRWLERHVLGT
ncbi:MAG: D-arabinono-1,4-lactone oxidase [Solirubrobacteraceae bacterium]